MTASEKRRSSRNLAKSPAISTAKNLSVKGRTSPIIEKLKEWRKNNNLSQRQAVEVMGMRDFPVTAASLKSWEQGVTSPGKLASKALESFLVQHPKITDAPVYGRWKSPNKDVGEIRKLRKSGMTLLSIGERFGLSESAVSRICAGNRRATAVQKAPIREI
jgi:transcriptional regulator with XRE-family HTH domain